MSPDRSMPPLHLLIIGCSTRAAAWSARRAGMIPICIDQFGDEDLKAVARVIAISHRSDDILNAIDRCRADGWIAIGGLEHRSELLDRLSERTREICQRWCGSSEDVKVLKNPWLLQKVARDCGWNETQIWTTYEQYRSHVPSSSAETWLLKPRYGGGGGGVRKIQPCESLRLADFAEHYCQQFVDGELSSVIINIEQGRATCLGSTRLLCGGATRDSEFQYLYHGNIGPLPLLPDMARRWEETALQLTKLTDYRGLLGLDYVRTECGIHLIEVNPRYTASCEVLELALQIPILRRHLRAWSVFEDVGEPLTGSESERIPIPCLGKCVVYARHPVHVTSQFSEIRIPDLWAIPSITDIPTQGTIVEAGQPACTVWVAGSDVEEVQRQLQTRVRAVHEQLRENVIISEDG